MPNSKRPGAAEVAEEAYCVLRSTAVFEPAPDAELRVLAAHARVERVDAETVLCAAGEHLDSLRYIRAGSVRAALTTAGGAGATSPPIMPGGWATWPGVFYSPPPPYDLVAGAGSQFFVFPRTRVLSLADAYPLICRRVIDELSLGVRAITSLMLSTGAENGERALARAILAAASLVTPPQEGPVRLAITKEDVGRLGFGSRQRVSRLLQSLTAAGVTRARYGVIEVPSLLRLEAYAEGAEAD